MNGAEHKEGQENMEVRRLLTAAKGTRDRSIQRMQAELQKAVAQGKKIEGALG